MSWDRDPLWAKARLFFGRALEHPREDPQFGLWCALGIELLARAAVASISPALLAEPDRGQKNLLYAIGRGDPRSGPKSIGATQVIQLCEHLFDRFTEEHATSARALIGQRNMELHSGDAAFANYDTQQWISGFYGCCRALCEATTETLESLFGEEEAAIALEVLAETEREVLHGVRSKIAAHNRVFSERDEPERARLAEVAEHEVERLVKARHHRVTCPACSSAATVEGDAFGDVRVQHDNEMGEIVVRQAVAPKRFACWACGLRLQGFGELRAAGVGSQYTRTSRYSPEDYFDLINPEDTDRIQDLVDEHLNFLARYEYDNE